jgi:hypothetical protein
MMMITGKYPLILECRYHYSSESSCFTFLQLSAFNRLFWCSQEVRIAKGGIRNLSHPNRGTSLKPTYQGEGFGESPPAPRGVPGFKPYTLHFSISRNTHLEAYISFSHSFISTIQLSNIRYQTLPTTVLAARYTSRLEGIPDLPLRSHVPSFRNLTPRVSDISIRAYQFPRQIGLGDTIQTSSILTPERLSS